MDGREIRQTLLTVIHEKANDGPNLQSRIVLIETARRLGILGDLEAEQALLTYWHDLFRTGYVAWGYKVESADPPFLHITEQGRRALAHLSRDPMNPDGYMTYLNSLGSLAPIPQAYITEALKTYVADCHKATAIMVGGAAESIILQLRDALISGMKRKGETIPAALTDWKIKTILDAMGNQLQTKKGSMPKHLFEAFEANWPAFTLQIRTARNDVGHPTSVDPVTQERVHASLLIFPELARLAFDIEKWITEYYA